MTLVGSLLKKGKGCPETHLLAKKKKKYSIQAGWRFRLLHYAKLTHFTEESFKSKQSMKQMVEENGLNINCNLSSVEKTRVCKGQSFIYSPLFLQICACISTFVLPTYTIHIQIKLCQLLLYHNKKITEHQGEEWICHDFYTVFRRKV